MSNNYNDYHQHQSREIKEEFGINVPIITIPRGCPLCENNVKGNKQYKLYCKSCNIFFNTPFVTIS